MNDLSFAMAIAQDNPGALRFAMEMLKEENSQYLIPIGFRLNECPSIRGTNAYVLWSDLCNKDISIVAKLCDSSITNEVLEDACNRQDHSGRELVKDYI